MTRRRRVVLIAFLALLPLELGGAGLAGYVAWRSRQPTRRLKVDFGAEPLLLVGVPTIAFVGTGRLAVAQSADDGRGHGSTPCQVWSLETGAVERTLPDLPRILDTRTGRGLVSSDGGADLVMDFTTGLAAPLPSRGDVDGLGPGAETFATVTSTGLVEVRTVKDGSRARALALPVDAPFVGKDGLRGAVVFAPRGERLGICLPDHDVLIGELATASWSRVGRGEHVRFTPNGFVFWPRIGESVEYPIWRNARGSREIAATPREGVGQPYAVSESGERFARVRLDATERPAEVVVEATETGEALRRVPLAPGSEVLFVALSAEGERLAVAYMDGTVEVWEIPGP